MAFFAGSCQQENLEPVAGNGTVTFTVEAPANVQTKAIADGLNVDQLVYEVWITENLGNLTQNAQKLYQATTTMAVENGVNKATITLDLVNDQKFTVLFWAQVDAADAYNTNELTAVTYAKDEYKANDESLAAFYAVAYVDDCMHVTKDGTATGSQVKLTRPFAQLNLGTLNTSTAYTVALVSSKVNVKNVNQVFNVATSKASLPEEMTFVMNEVPSNPSTLDVNGVSYEYAGMNYMFAGDNVIVEYDIVTSLNGGMEGTVNNVVSEVPLKENYRTNIIGNLLTSKVDYEIVVDADFQIPDEFVGEGVVVAKDTDELINALKDTNAPEHLTIELLGNQTKAVTPVEYQIPVGAWTEKYYFGGNNTKTITINANGNKINFVHENSDWNYIRCVNDAAKWIINDATLTNSGKNDGPWNRHDIRFYNAVELNNVTSDKAIALLNDGELNDVTITEDTGAYGLWITAQGQKVDINGLNITATNGGRGIAIKEQYVDAPACVTLNVENAKFETAEKAAILVTSTAGAVINWGAGNDIKGVAADPINAVWVDEDYAQYDSVVKVEGASKVVEGAIDNVAAATQESLNEALADAGAAETTVVVNLAEGTYTFPASSLSANVVLNCAEGTVFQGNSKANINGATVIGATFSNPSGSAVDQTINGTFKDCVFEGANALRWCYAGETVVFENCVFSGSTYGVHFDDGANDVLFKNCTFSGFNAFGAAITLVTFDGCTFKSNGKSGYNGANLWGSAKMIDTEFIFDGNATYEWVDCLGADKTYEFTGCTINNGNFLNETYVTAAGIIKVDGTDYDLNNSTFISTAEELFAFANEVNVNKNAFNGKTVYLVADIDLDNAVWTPVGQTGATTFNGVFDGQNHTISNLNVNSEAQTGKHYSSGLFGWVESHTAGHGHIKNVNIAGATISGHHNCGALVGYITQETALVENCHVTSATITCTKANDDADGDKAGALIGNATVATPVMNCTASNSTVSAGRDAGQVIGAGKEANVTGCSASNVTVEANGTSTGANVRNEVIGRRR
jgi:hypothetical protein